MNTDRSIQKYQGAEITPAIETFADQLNAYLSNHGLPQENILVAPDRRKPVLNNMPEVLVALTAEQKMRAVYISKFVAASAIGLFDAALNYLWDETVYNLRQKVANFDVVYFFDSVVTDPNRRSKLKNESDLDKIDDWDLIRGCRITGIITENGFRHLDYIRGMRNHASAAHPNQNDITGLQLVSWLETCIIEVLSKEPDGPVIEIGKLLHSLRTQQLSKNEALVICAGLPSLPDDLSQSLLRAVLGMYTDADIDSQTKDNIKLVASPIWEISSEEARRDSGLKQATLAVNGETARAALAREFIEIVGGQDYLAEATRVAEMSIAIENLMTAHNGWDNFYNETTPARLLHKLVPKSGRVPRSIVAKYIKIVTMCRIGNGYGVSWFARSYYDELLLRFDDSHILIFVNLVHDADVSSRLQLSMCASLYKTLASEFETRAVRQPLKEVLAFIKEHPSDRLTHLASDDRYRQLRRTLRI